ncbi:hypothetical protein [Conexibacter arvalis]|uniref:Uncharacterized protein n=1 Tax=Conexibacter arvalis TaxID=912552 RepID=A0A840IJJ0_9ACTN|nr:hypothetical protein [Conexibacter arvalis]MBB4664889.1 hypothetical protein [Conexibacter arvalis]
MRHPERMFPRAAALRAALAAAVAAALIVPASAAAQEPQCAPEPASLLSMRLPDQIVRYRWYDVPVRKRSSTALSAPRQKATLRFKRGAVEWDDTLDTGQYDSFWLVADYGSGPVDVELSYLEHQVTDWGEDGEPWDMSEQEIRELIEEGWVEFYGGLTTTCRRTVTATVPVIEGVRQPKPTIWTFKEAWGEQADAQVRMRRPSGCARRYSAQPFVFSVRRQGTARWTTVSSSDPCEGWKRGGRGAGLRLRADDGTLHFIPLTPARTGITQYSFRIAQGRLTAGGVAVGRTLRKGRFVVRTSHTPTRRIYALVGGYSNAEYWNYCVRYGRDVWHTGDNVYCVKPRETWRNLQVRG